jgi:hypothetical protein
MGEAVHGWTPRVLSEGYTRNACSVAYGAEYCLALRLGTR